MKTIKLACGKLVLIDDESYDIINIFKWHKMKSRNTFYAVRRTTINGKVALIYMHNLLISKTNGQVTDHIDGNGLNNQLSNLRLSTSQENIWNQAKRRNNTSGYKGVSYSKGKWMARIMKSGKSTFLGLFHSSIDAAKAYNTAALEQFGEYAKINIL